MSSVWKAVETKVPPSASGEVENGMMGIDRFSVLKVEWVEVREGCVRHSYHSMFSTGLYI